ncbi:MAG: matrixin family metalloprotease [Burkholderiales bacterium]|nr:matrixin family metalloprotease [Burkholderiales bacterium]
MATRPDPGRPLAQAIRAAHRYCTARYPAPPTFAAGVSGARARLLRESAGKWLNGSTLRYWFFDKPARWAAPEAQKNVVREAFRRWKAVGIGLDFVEVGRRAEADLRIAFEAGDGSWSYVGTDVRTARDDPRTMNFGWSLTEDAANGIDTALHEIGHTLGFPHEHQNPFAGIVWNEPAVYRSLAKPPNGWSRATTFANIIEKIAPDTVQGSAWDPDSIMHYPFEAGLIDRPARYRAGLAPAGGLSARDRAWVRRFYPPRANRPPAALKLLETAPLALAPGEQAEFRFTPAATRDYEFRTFGSADTVIALYERRRGGAVELAADDDSGDARNAYLKVRLAARRTYLLRVRLNYRRRAGETAVMVW